MSKDARHYDTIVSPVITEKATIASESNQFVFKVRREATKPQIKAAIEKLFDVKVTAVNTLLRKGKNKVFRGVRGKQQDVEESRRDARGWSPHRCDQRSLRVQDNGSQDIQSDDAGPTPIGHRRSQRTPQGQTGEGSDRRQSEKGGRNNAGRITVRFRGGGHKQSYRHDRLQASQARRRRHGRAAGIRPNRTSFIALVRYEDGERAYIVAPQRLGAGDTVVAGVQVDVKPGNAMPLANIPVGTIVHNVEMKIGKGGAIARSAGSYAQIVARDQGYVSLRLSSGEQRLIHGQCFATVGAVSNPDHMNTSMGKAGRHRWLGQRPTIAASR